MDTEASRKKYRYDKLYMDIAKRVAQMSYATRAQVGAVIVKDGRIISMGWNGMPSGWDNKCEQPRDEIMFQGHYYEDVRDDETRKEVLHAESNAIAKLARSNECGLGATMYCTISPCMDCAKLIHQAGISNVVYEEQYRNTDGIQFLRECAVYVQQLIDHRKEPKMDPDEPPSVYNGGKTMNEQYKEAVAMSPKIDF